MVHGVRHVGSRKPLWALVVVAAGCCGSPGVARGQAPAVKPPDSTPPAECRFPDDGIFWADPEHTRAYFISEAVLSSYAVDELPLRAADREKLKKEPDQAAIDAEEKTYFRPRPRPYCTIDLHPAVGYLEAGARPLVEVLRTLNLVVVGRVIEVVPGLVVNDPYGWTDISSMVELQVEEVLKRDGEEPQVGQRIFYQQRHASIWFRGRRMCTEAGAGGESFRAAPGQRVLVTATGLDHNDPRAIYVSWAWPLSDAGEILPQRYRQVIQAKPIPLSAVRQSLSKGSPQ